MENRKAIIISLICFVIAILLITAYVNVKRNEMTKEFGEEVPVVVATMDIPEYGIIRPGMVTVIRVFKNFKQPQTAADVNDIIGKASYVAISRNEQITMTKLIHQDGKPVLDRQVQKKMRAVTVVISPHTGVGRLIRPGNRVDVIIAPTYDSGGVTVYEVKTLLQDVLVLATGKNIQNEVPTRVDKAVLTEIEEEFERKKRKDFFGTTESLRTSRPSDDYSHITLQVSPEDAEKLAFITHTFGDRSIYLVLRNRSDHGVEKAETTLLDNVLGPESDYGRTKIRPPPYVPPRPKFYDSEGGRPVPVY